MIKSAIKFNIVVKRLVSVHTVNSIVRTRLNFNILRNVGTRHYSSRIKHRTEDVYIKAVVLDKYGGPENLQVANKLKPLPCPGDVLIRVEAAGINPVDTYIREGMYKFSRFPAILGKEVAGTIEAFGEKVVNEKFNFKVGDRVFARLNENGGYCEYVSVDINDVFPLHENLTFAQGAAIYVTYFTAYRALFIRDDINVNDTVLIHGGTGGVGTAAIQLAKRIGVERLGATAGTEEGMEFLKKIGANYVFNHRKKGHMYEAKEAMTKQGFDYILENLADVNLGDDCNVLGPNGRIAVVGCRGLADITPRSLMVTEGTITGVSLGRFTPEELEECTNNILEWISYGYLQPIVGHEYTLDEAQQAHKDMIHKPSSHGKLVFRMTHEKISSQESVDDY